jgi:ABC-type dipeptide/oligopeptide/nickel transport system permease subunit
MSTTAITFRRRVAGNARHNPLAAIGVVLVIVFVICALFAPWIAPQDPAAINLPARLDTPSHAHWFGTDELGRDIFSRIIYGARISMLVGSSVVLFSLALGLIIGSVAGYYGGAIDRFVNVVLMNAFLSFPGILLAIAFVAFRGPGIFLRSHLAGGSATLGWFVGKYWRRESVSSWKRRVPLERAICASSPATFCRISFSR